MITHVFCIDNSVSYSKKYFGKMSSHLHGLVSFILTDMQSRFRLFNQLTDTSMQAKTLGQEKIF